MKKLIFLGTIVLGTIVLAAGCANSPVGKPCDIDAAGQKKAMDNIGIALLEDPQIRADQYINDDFSPQGIYNGNGYCTFIIRPWTPIVSELIWDGTLGVRVKKETLEVEEIQRIDSK